MDNTPEQPQAEYGFVKTLNRMGFMTTGLDRYSQAFVDFAGQAGGPVLEVGAAYGIATLPALAAGATVIANDLDPRHLEVLKTKIPPEALSRIQFLPGAFPDDLDIASGSLSGALLARILHFLPGDIIERGVAKLYDWLKPGGKVFVTAETPYIQNLKRFHPVYEERIRQGDPWPGVIDDFAAFASAHSDALPAMMNFLDDTVLRRIFTQAGFEVETAGMFARPEFPEVMQFDGRESVGIIAVKPLV